MTIEILDKAEDDLVSGFAFYESQQTGLGVYFRDSLISTLNRSGSMAEFIASSTGIIIVR